ncbi:MAG: hypothetical protein AAB221_03595 [Bacteroidota bacterium]
MLTLKQSGSFVCKNTVTGITVSGTFAYSNFHSIYGDRQKMIFSPKLPMLSEDYFVLVDNPNGKMVFGDNYTDGYVTTFEIIP